MISYLINYKYHILITISLVVIGYIIKNVKSGTEVKEEEVKEVANGFDSVSEAKVVRRWEGNSGGGGEGRENPIAGDFLCFF